MYLAGTREEAVLSCLLSCVQETPREVNDTPAPTPNGLAVQSVYGACTARHGSVHCTWQSEVLLSLLLLLLLFLFFKTSAQELSSTMRSQPMPPEV